jgi:hypothetical protein
MAASARDEALRRVVSFVFIHIGIANARKDFLHQTTTISKNHVIVCIEDLLADFQMDDVAPPGVEFVRAAQQLHDVEGLDRGGARAEPD